MCATERARKSRAVTPGLPLEGGFTHHEYNRASLSHAVLQTVVRAALGGPPCSLNAPCSKVLQKETVPTQHLQHALHGGKTLMTGANITFALSTYMR
jgi:hypothetical protein